MHKEVKEILKIRFKLAVLEFAQGIGSVTKACREFEVPRSTFYEWKKAYNKEGKTGLARKKPIAINHFFVSAKFGSFMIFLKLWLFSNKITQGEMDEY